MTRLLAALALVVTSLTAVVSTPVVAASTRYERPIVVATSGSVFVLLRHGILPSSMASRRAVTGDARSAVATELREGGATNVRSYWLIDGVSATLSTRALAELRVNPSVRAIVPDATVHLLYTPRTVRSTVPAAKRDAGCGSSPTTPLLEPEALQLTNTAFSDPATPQASSLASGTGVTVAILADSLNPKNPDFQRNGSSVITNYSDFTGFGTKVSNSGAEAFGDASSIAAQGNDTYNVDAYVAKADPQHTGCLPIKIEGVAPGANVMALKIFEGDEADEGVTVSGIQYAVSHGANVINESFGYPTTPNLAVDPIQLANDAAVAAGVTVVAAAGDSGTSGGTMGSPAVDPQIITVGASTQLQAYRQDSFALSQLGSGGYDSDNISAISSGGVSDSGLQTVDVVAPGDLGWAPCSPNPRLYYDCGNNQGAPSTIELFGGTSEASPLTAGEAALVIQAYRQSHSGASPTPAVVKQLIMSTATDLHEPVAEQGAGLIDSLAAVQAATAYGQTSSTGPALLTSPSVLTATTTVGVSPTMNLTVTNQSSTEQTVSPVLRSLVPFTTNTSKLTINGKSKTTARDEYGEKQVYVKHAFTVPPGADYMDVSIAWSATKQPWDYVQMTLFDPSGNVAGYSFPQDSAEDASNFGNVDVHDPSTGQWTAVLWTPRE